MKLNQNAVDNFNKKAEDLLNDIIIEQIPAKKVSKRKGFSPDVHISASIKPIGDVYTSRGDGFGNRVSREVHFNGQTLKIVGEEYQKLKQIAQAIQRMPDFHKSVSVDFVIDIIFDWIKNKHKKETSLLMVDYVILECEKKVQEREIWIPVAYTYIESELEFGNVKFKTITREMLDHYENGFKERHPDYDPKMEHYFEDKRKKLLGFAAATIKLNAEPDRAYEIAIKDADESISLLRCLNPMNCFPLFISYSTPLGFENLESYEYFFVDNNKIVNTTSGVNIKGEVVWLIDNRLIDELKPLGIEKASLLLKEETKTPFQKDVLNVLLLYSKTSLHKRLADKLNYILTAIEGILRFDRKDLIIQDLAERFAIIADQELDGRKKALNLLNQIYDLRPKFVYEEFKQSDIEVLKDFMLLSWVFFINLIGHSDKFKTKDDFLRSIDNLKLSGGLR